MYSDREDGLCGNDDAGQMSAWYIFSSLGFYPVTPGSTVYALGSPSIVKATIRLDNGKMLTINTVGQGRENVYVEKVEINGKAVSGHTIDHSDITNGGTMTFFMSSKPVLN
jgi:putative alpha-1,2-mannosidase